MRPVPLLLATVLLLAGCASGDYTGTASSVPKPPTREAEYTGVVIDLSEGRVLVRAEGDACGIWVAPSKDVAVFEATIDSHDPVAWSNLAEGQTVHLWIPGPIAESCPMQGAAAAVVIDASS
jgi:hypothetical protein